MSDLRSEKPSNVNMSNAMSPNFLAYLDEERQFQDAHQKGKVRRVKFERPNEAWLVRFLPVGLGERNLWYVRQGQHWLNKVPIGCPQCVSPDFGGDPNAPCQVCELAEALNAENDDAVSTFGFRLRTNITYLTYCLVYEIDPGRGESQVMSEADIMKPWEFQHYKSSFDELINYFRRGVTAKRPYSVLDLERGNDFWAVKTTKGVRLDRQEPGPIIATDDPVYEAKLDQIFAAISQPRIKIPTAKELETFARKAEAAAFDADDHDRERGRDRGERSERGGRDRYEEDGGPHRSGRGGRRMAAATDTEAEPRAEEEDQVPGAEVPARRPAPAQAPVGRPGRTAAPAAAPAAARPVTRPATAAVVAPARPAVRPGARQAAAAATPVRPAASRPVSRPAPAAAATAASSVNEEEDPGVADEATDPVGPAAEPLPEEGGEPAAEGVEPAAESQDQEEAPPAPATRTAHAAPAAAPTGLRSRLINRVRTAA